MLFWLDEEKREGIERDPNVFLESLGDAAISDDYFDRAAARFKLKDRKGARALLKVALQRNFSHLKSLYGMALLAFIDKKKPEGERWLVRAIRMDKNASESVVYLQKRLRILMDLPTAVEYASWALRLLEKYGRANDRSHFELGKTLFEQSQFTEAVPYLNKIVQQPDYSFEATQYLSYIYEHLYEGGDLINKTLDLISKVEEKADLFFNLAMVCQHNQNRPDLALHFFYLASLCDPEDPGLKFSLEQAAIELIGSMDDAKSPSDFLVLMLAHFRHGAKSVAERYALILRENFQWSFPESFLDLDANRLWSDWILEYRGPLLDHLEIWFDTTFESTSIAQLEE